MRGVYLTRTGGQNRPLTTPELRQLLLDRGESGYESQPVEGAGLADLGARGTAISTSSACRLTPTRSTRSSVRLRHAAQGRRVARAEPAPTAAGVLLFGREPQRYLRSAEVICVRYAGTVMGDEFVRQDIGGTLVEQAKQAETFVTANMRRHAHPRHGARGEHRVSAARRA